LRSFPIQLVFRILFPFGNFILFILFFTLTFFGPSQSFGPLSSWLRTISWRDIEGKRANASMRSRQQHRNNPKKIRNLRNFVKRSCLIAQSSLPKVNEQIVSAHHKKFFFTSLKLPSQGQAVKQVYFSMVQPVLFSTLITSAGMFGTE
jgi:hypothetical protein